MPGNVSAGEYDLAGCIVGVVDRARMIDGRRIKPGDVILGLPSNGLHTNGYSLARKILFEQNAVKAVIPAPGIEIVVRRRTAPHAQELSAAPRQVPQQNAQGPRPHHRRRVDGQPPARFYLTTATPSLTPRAGRCPPIFQILEQRGRVDRARKCIKSSTWASGWRRWSRLTMPLRSRNNCVRKSSAESSAGGAVSS